VVAGEKIDGTRTWDTWVAAAVDSHNQKDGDEARLDCPGHRVLIDLCTEGERRKAMKAQTKRANVYRLVRTHGRES
jgi:hypothetical protein